MVGLTLLITSAGIVAVSMIWARLGIAGHWCHVSNELDKVHGVGLRSYAYPGVHRPACAYITASTPNVL